VVLSINTPTIDDISNKNNHAVNTTLPTILSVLLSEVSKKKIP
jgi:hypothetical protein